VTNYFYCRIRPKGLLCDAEREIFTAIDNAVYNGDLKKMIIVLTRLWSQT